MSGWNVETILKQVEQLLAQAGALPEAAKEDELLTVLSVPAVPLHNNAAELQAQVRARRRDVSLHSRSRRGAPAMDILTSLVQT